MGTVSEQWTLIFLRDLLKWVQKGSTSEIVVHKVRQHTCSTIIKGFNNHPLTTDKTRQLFCSEKLATFPPELKLGILTKLNSEQSYKTKKKYFYRYLNSSLISIENKKTLLLIKILLYLSSTEFSAQNTENHI